MIAESLGKTNEALESFKKALQLDNNNVFAKKAIQRISDEFITRPVNEDLQPQNTQNEELEKEEQVENSENQNESLIDEEASSTDSDLWKSFYG